ncbi:TonB-dependent siderophore receptor [Thioclava kandeliae]|uniref:TonB-dependent siderophore receptor n=1 Tax=Thioclava kandeliae TaxID=3070818 RepID=A0ABV1SJB9_9RHOB
MTSPLHTPSRMVRPMAIAALMASTALTLLPVHPAMAQDSADGQSAGSDTYALPPIIVRENLAYSGAVTGYLAPATETGVKSGVPLAEVPQSITVVTSTELEARKPRQVEDAIAYSAGVNASTWGTDDRYDQFSIRGFDMGPNALYRDGLPQKALNFSGFTSDPYMIERVDVLRGPAGVLYGSNDAGGMVNLVTKRPVFGPLAEVEASYNSNDTASVGFDLGNVLNESGTLAGRLTGLVRRGETDVEDSANDRQFVAGSLTWAPTDATSLTVLGHVQHDSLTPILMGPINGEDIDPSWGSLPDDWLLHEPDYNEMKTTQQSIGWDFTHDFGGGLRLNQRLRYAHQDTDYRQLDYSYAAEEGVYYYPFHNVEDARSLGFDTNIEYGSTVYGAENSLTFGADYQLSRYKVTQYLDDSTYLVSYDDPSYDFDVTEPGLSSVTHSRYEERGLYLQDHMKFDQGTTLTFGLRHSWFETKQTDDLAGTSDTQKDQATTYMIGVTHELANGLTPYASYTEGFTQNIGKTITGAALDPSKSRQFEAGLRYAPSADLMLSGAVFDLRKTNVKDYDTTDPTWSSFSQAGEIRSRGIELEARGRLTPTLQGVASYTYLDTEITKNGDASLIGNENAMAPHHQISLWLDQDLSSWVEGLSVGAGARFVSSSYSTQDNLRKTPGHTLLDLAVHYEAEPLSVDFGVTNLLDRDYYGVCYDGYGCALGEGRVATLTLSRTF